MRHNTKRCRPNAFFVKIGDDDDTYTYEIVGKGEITPVSISKSPVMPVLNPEVDEKRKRVYSCRGILTENAVQMFDLGRHPDPMQMPATVISPLPPITDLLRGMPIYTLA